MNKLFFLTILLLTGCTFNEVKSYESFNVADTIANNNLSNPCADFNALNNKIRDGKISKAEALKELQRLIPLIKQYYYENGGQDFDKTSWVFPVQGYNVNSVGGTNGNGYIATGYDYFDGNKHKGHPAQDIFILDKNQDCLNDGTNSPVNVLSMTGGVVIATESSWDSTSVLRGGKYIWIYDPYSHSFFYYAHNKDIFVKPCDIVKPGDTIATVGRTGLNAFKKRSPTHLHFMQLKLDENNYPRAINCFNDLVIAKTK